MFFICKDTTFFLYTKGKKEKDGDKIERLRVFAVLWYRAIKNTGIDIKFRGLGRKVVRTRVKTCFLSSVFFVLRRKLVKLRRKLIKLRRKLVKLRRKFKNWFEPADVLGYARTCFVICS